MQKAVSRDWKRPLSWVDLVRHYSNRSDLVFDLEHTARNLRASLQDTAETSISVRSKPNPKARRSVADRVTEDDIATIIAEFQSGTAAWRLAERYGIGETSVKGILRERKARRCDTADELSLFLLQDLTASLAGGGRLPGHVLEVQIARREGHLPEHFRTADLRRACPGWTDGMYRVFLSSYRLGNPGGRTPYFKRHHDGSYSLVAKPLHLQSPVRSFIISASN